MLLQGLSVSMMVRGKESKKYRVVFFNWSPLKSSNYKTIYVNVDTPNLGFTYFNSFFLGGGAVKKPPCIKPFNLEEFCLSNCGVTCSFLGGQLDF